MAADEIVEPEELAKQIEKDLKNNMARTYRVALRRAVGVDLLDIISSDLYKDSRHVLRELISNSYDEGATEVSVVVTGGSVVVKDNARGMVPARLANTRRVAESEKVYEPKLYEEIGFTRGFRKMGVYAAYQIAERLVYTTKTEDAHYECELVFDFRRMREEREKNKEREEAERWDFPRLVEECTTVTAKKVDQKDIDESYTIASIEGIAESYPQEWAKLKDRDQLIQYFIDNFDLDFEVTFQHRLRIHDHLRRYVKGWHPLIIKLTIEGMPEETLRRPPIEKTDAPELYVLPREGKRGDKQLAAMWVCRRKDHALDNERARGIAYKVGGVTVGKRTAGHDEAIRREHGYFYDRFSGEVHVTDPSIRPDPERFAFSRNQAVEQLEAEVNLVVAELTSKATQDRRALKTEHASSKAIKKAEKTLWPALKSKATTATPSNLESVLVELVDLRKQLQVDAYTAPASEEQKAQVLIKEITQVEKDLRKKRQRPRKAETLGKIVERTKTSVPKPFIKALEDILRKYLDEDEYSAFLRELDASLRGTAEP